MTVPAGEGHGQPGPDKAGLEKLPKAKLIAMILEQREDTRIRLEEKDQQITELSEQLAKLQGEFDKEKTGRKFKAINQHVNQPTSKKPEWDKDGNRKPATKGEKDKKKKRQKRTGCGNRGKSDLTPDETNVIPLASCPGCGNDPQLGCSGPRLAHHLKPRRIGKRVQCRNNWYDAE